MDKFTFEKLQNMYFLPNIIRVITLNKIGAVGYIACMVEMRSKYQMLVRIDEGKSTIGRLGRRWQADIKMDPGLRTQFLCRGQ